MFRNVFEKRVLIFADCSVIINMIDPYQCSNGLCVAGTTWCDGYMDCPEGEDEKPDCKTSEELLP